MGSRLVLGASTCALVLLASGGTAVLVTHGTQGLHPVPLTAPPPVVGNPRPAPTPLVVPPAPGSVLFGPATTRPVVRPAVHVVGPVPVQDVPAAPEEPAAEPPSVVAPPVVPEPPVVDEPVVDDPVVSPPVPGKDKGVRGPSKGRPDDDDRGFTAVGKKAHKDNRGHHKGQQKHAHG